MPADGDRQPIEAFEIAYTGRCVELLLHPPVPDSPPPEPAAIVAALRRSPLRSIDASHLARVLSEHANAPADARVAIGEVAVPAYDGAPCVIVVSIDRFAAYAVPVDPPPGPPTDVPAAGPPTDAAAREEPPSNETSAPQPSGDAAPETADAPPPAAPAPPIVTAEGLRALLAAARVVGGLLDDVIDAFGTGAPLPDIRCVARGQHPIPGTDARLESNVDLSARGAPVPIEHGSVDFHALAIQRFVPAGAPLVTRHPPVAGTPGYDVLGTVTEPPPVRDVDLKRAAGPNTTLAGDAVISNIVGRPVITSRGSVEVLPVFEVAGNVDYAIGNIDFPGDVIIRGDVKSGFSIVSGGSVSVRGLVEGASITAAHNLSVTGTVGGHRTVFEVGGDLNARYLHTTVARVAGTVSVIGEIVNCSITAERVRTSAQGRIVGGLIEAQTEVDSGTLGSREGNVTEVRVTSDSPDAVIRGRQMVHPGLVVLIGDTRKRIVDQIDGASFWSVSGTVLSLKPAADVAAAEAARASQPAA